MNKKMTKKILILEDRTKLDKLVKESFDFVVEKLKQNNDIEISYANHVSCGIDYLKHKAKFDIAVVNPELGNGRMKEFLAELKKNAWVIIASIHLYPELIKGTHYNHQIMTYTACTLINQIREHTNPQ